MGRAGLVGSFTLPHKKKWHHIFLSLQWRWVALYGTLATEIKLHHTWLPWWNHLKFVLGSCKARNGNATKQIMGQFDAILGSKLSNQTQKLLRHLSSSEFCLPPAGLISFSWPVLLDGGLVPTGIPCYYFLSKSDDTILVVCGSWWNLNNVF